MEYKFKDVILKPRVTNWIKYRIPSIEFKDKYKKFREQYKDPVLEKEINDKIMGDKELFILSLENVKGLMLKLFEDYPDLLVKYTLQTVNEYEIKERFLIDNDLGNLKILFDILFDNSSEMDYNISAEDYNLIFTIFDNFFSPLQEKKDE